MQPTTKVHLGYIIGILAVINIVTLSVKWGDLKDVVTYISFAATLASLLLAMLAIVYSYVSSGSLISYSDRISRAGDDLKTTFTELKALVSRVDGLCNTIPTAFDDLKKQVSSTNEYLQNLSTDVPAPETGPPSPEDIAQVSIGKFAFLSSPLGLLAMRICVRSNETNIPFQLDKIAELLECDEAYLHGWLMATDAVGIVDIDTKKSQWKVRSVFAGISKHLDDAIQHRLQAIPKNKELPKDALSWFSGDLAKIDEYFKKDS